MVRAGDRIFREHERRVSKTEACEGRRSAAGAKRKVELSFAIPCYNEEANVVAMYEAVTAEAEQHVTSHEIIFIDNGSTDRTRELMREICARDPRVRAIFNNRNYGQMRSPTYAIYQAEGAAVIGMCCDFQDPPALDRRNGAAMARRRAGRPGSAAIGKDVAAARRWSARRAMHSSADSPIIRSSRA